MECEGAARRILGFHLEPLEEGLPVPESRGDMGAHVMNVLEEHPEWMSWKCTSGVPGGGAKGIT